VSNHEAVEDDLVAAGECRGGGRVFDGWDEGV
jgi:hypothetical protein